MASCNLRNFGPCLSHFREILQISLITMSVEGAAQKPL